MKWVGQACAIAAAAIVSVTISGCTAPPPGGPDKSAQPGTLRSDGTLDNGLLPEPWAETN
jgi:hypothetical protein